MGMVMMRTDLASDPRVVRVATATRVSKITVIGALHWLWAMGQTQSDDGHIPMVTFDAIDVEVGVPGFAQALESVCWLLPHESGVLIPDFETYNGKSAKNREQERLRKARNRFQKPKTRGKRTPGQHRDNVPLAPDIVPVQRDLHGATVTASVTHTNNGSERIGTDRNGTKRNESEREQNAVPVASRSLSPVVPDGGNPRPMLARFLSAYPKNRSRNADAIIAAWDAGGCEAQGEEIMRGLVAHKCGKDFTDGVIVNAERFIAERWWLTPPDAAPGAVKPSVIPKASDADQRRFRAWWNGITPGTQESWAARWGVPRSVVDQASNHQTVRAEWSEQALAAPAAGGQS